MKKKFIGDMKSERKKKALKNEMNLEKWCQHRDMWVRTQEMYIWKNNDITELNLTVTKCE